MREGRGKGGKEGRDGWREIGREGGREGGIVIEIGQNVKTVSVLFSIIKNNHSEYQN